MSWRPANDPNKLTFKEKKFIKALVVNKGNATQAVMDSYDVKKRITARQIADRVQRRPQVQAELMKIMDELGLDERGIMEKWRDGIRVGWGEKATHKDALRALKMTTQLRGMLYKDSPHLKVTLEQKAHKLTYDQLLTEFEHIKAKTSKLVVEGQIVY